MKKFFTAFFILFFVNTTFAQGSDKSEAVEKFVAKFGNKIISIASDKKLSDTQVRSEMVAEIDKVIDSEWIARFVLGKSYKTLSEKQKSKFEHLYREFMINTYGPKFKNYNGRKFTVLDVKKQNIFYVAKCEFLPKDSNKPIEIALRIKDREEKLVVLDFIAEGISLIETQRSEFNSTISQKGIEEFISDLEQRIKELKERK